MIPPDPHTGTTAHTPFIASLLAVKCEGLNTTYRHKAYLRFHASEDEMIGAITREAMADGFSVDGIVVVPVSAEMIERIAALRLAQGDGGSDRHE